MSTARRNRQWAGLLIPVALILIGAQFTFAAVQGNHGLFRRLQVEAERDALAAELDALRAEVAEMEVLTRRLSDDFLDLDLLDEEARRVLGLMRPDEVVLP
ncbi:septum formation initiator family protein [Rhodobacterales bacterium HKCCE2091]|nr:septum formation initiator family protein [Rhodobacterales bacterium HKCCE2091]